MKKSIILLLFAGLFPLPVFSQIKFGIKTGPIAILVPIYDISLGPVYIEPSHAWNLGIHAGVFFRIGTEVMYFQPEVVFEFNNFKYNVINNYDVKVVKQSINNLDIPLLVGAQFNVVRLCIGPSASIKIGSPEELVNDPDLNKLYNKIAMEYQLGFGIDLHKKIDLDIRYRGYLGKNAEGVEKIGNQRFTLHKSNSSFLFSIGYMFWADFLCWGLISK